MLTPRIIPYVVYSILLIISVYFFYFFYDGASYSSSAVTGYILIFFIFFSLYKYIQSLYGVKKYQVTPLLLIGVFFAHLFILSLYYVALSGNNFLLGTTLWFILGFKLLLILFIWYLIYLAGKKILDWTKIYSSQDEPALVFVSATIVGFFFLVISLFIIAALGWYNTFGLLLVGIMFGGFALPHIRTLPSVLMVSLTEQETKTDKGYVKTFIDEIHYIVITLFLGVNLISAYRPYPIGWDDLGAYMNYPKLLSGAEGLIALGNMYAWELYTGIGYILGSQSFAFLLNSFSGVVVSIALFCVLSLLKQSDDGGIFKKTQNESVFSYPLFATLILMILPMTVFQLAKDMKLDYGLLFVSLGALFISFVALYRSNKLAENWKIWVLVGICVGFAFTIKITSILLLFAIIGFLAYRYGGISLYFASFFVIITLLTLGGLWSMLNVVFPSDGNAPILFAYGSMALTGVLLYICYRRNNGIGVISDYLRIVSFVILGFIIAFLPWGIKNTLETLDAGRNISVGSLISGQSERLQLDFTLIHSEEEVRAIRQATVSGIGQDGITTNEDFGRYFGYESGINNYLKLPWNLTFQVNQGGEFTQITFIFFLLLPVFFFVFQYKTSAYVYGLFISGVVLLLYYIPTPLSLLFTGILGNIGLPLGYVFITLFYFAALLYLSVSIKKDQDSYSSPFLAILAFTSLYVFFWAISSFGVVWYGIVMYAAFLALIVLGLYESDKQKYMYLPYLALFGVWIYLLFTGFSHATNNLKTAGYLDFKLGQVTEYQAVMKYHPEYFEFLFAFNLSQEGQDEVLRDTRRALVSAFQGDENFSQLIPLVNDANTPELLYDLIRTLDRVAMPRGIERQYSQIKENLFTQIIAPDYDIRSTENIYRIGTFMSYFMVDNNTRVRSDNLINDFDRFIWDDDMAIISQRFRDLGIGYLIFDLNAATIDDDPRRDLTRRYENLLRYALSSEVEYITGDSTCFRLARDLYQTGDIPLESALSIAGTNYGTPDERNSRLTDCVITVYEAIQQGVDNDERFSYLREYRTNLENILQLLSENNIEITQQEIITQLARTLPRGFKVLLRIPE